MAQPQTVVAVAQIGAQPGAVQANLAHVIAEVEHAADLGARLVVFPECILTGYMFDSRAAGMAAALTVHSTELDQLAEVCARRDMHVVVGFLETVADKLYNTAALIGPGGVIGRHHKRHLPHLGVDRFVDEPDQNVDVEVFDTPLGRIGVLICYEVRFPEVARTLALRGADMIALPTAWPMASRMLPEMFAPVRAAENLVYVLAANRPDQEAGAEFVGLSRIIEPTGTVVVTAAENGEQLLTAAIDVETARTKKIVFQEGVHVVAPFDDRRPRTYTL